jgi:hypothetical protein
MWIVAGGGIPPAESFATFIWDSPNIPPLLALLGLGCVPWLGTDRLTMWARRLFWIGVVFVVPMSVGRAAWLGFAVALLAYFSFQPDGLRRRRGLIASGTLAGIVTVVGIVATLRGALDTRLMIWGDAVRTFARDPLTGGGPSTFSWLRLELQDPYAFPVVTEHTHNIALQTLADGGLILLVGFGTVVGAYVLAAWRSWSSASAAHRTGYAVLLGFAAALQLDYVGAFNSLFALAVAIAAWSLPTAATATRTPRHMRLGVAALTSAILLSTVVPVATISGARLAAAKGREAYREQRFGEALAHFVNASALYPESAAYAMGRGASLLALGEADAAHSAFLTAAQLSRGDPRAWALAASTSTERSAAMEYLHHASVHANGSALYPYLLSKAMGDDASDPIRTEQQTIAVAWRPSLLFALTSDEGAKVINELPAVVDRFGGRARIDISRLAADIALAHDRLPPVDFPAWRAVAYARQHDRERAVMELDRSEREHRHARSTWVAYVAAGRLLCDDELVRRGHTMLALLTERRRIAVVDWDPIYREDGLGDYGLPELPTLPANDSPLSMLNVFPQCP